MILIFYRKRKPGAWLLNIIRKTRRITMRNLKNLKNLVREEDGMGTVEIILIIVVLVGLVIIFKDRITDLVNNIFDKITKETNKI